MARIELNNRSVYLSTLLLEAAHEANTRMFMRRERMISQVERLKNLFLP